MLRRSDVVQCGNQVQGQSSLLHDGGVPASHRSLNTEWMSSCSAGTSPSSGPLPLFILSECWFSFLIIVSLISVSPTCFAISPHLCNFSYFSHLSNCLAHLRDVCYTYFLEYFNYFQIFFPQKCIEIFFQFKTLMFWNIPQQTWSVLSLLCNFWPPILALI